MLAELRVGLAAAGLIVDLTLRSGGVFTPGSEDDASSVDLRGPTYFNDEFIVCTAASPHELVGRLKQVANLVLHTTARHGLVANFRPGKTEALVRFRGLGTIAARHALFDSVDAAGSPVLDLDQGQQLRIVRHYTHLGGLITDTSSLGREVTARTASGMQAARSLGHRVFADSSLRADTKGAVYSACVASRLTLYAGTWDGLSAKQAAKLDSVTAYVARRSRREFGGPGRCNFSNVAMCERAGLPRASRLVMAARLRYAARVCVGAPAVLLALLQGAAGKRWREAVIGDLQVIRREMPQLASMPCPVADLGAWEQLWLAYQQQWTRLVSRWIKACGVSGSGARVDEVAATPLAPPVTCWDCHRDFTSRSALMTHRMRVHGHRGWTHGFVIDTCCPCCHVQFHNRWRLRHHLQYSSKLCGTAFAAAIGSGQVAMADHESIASADVLDRVARRDAMRCGRSWLQGPPARPQPFL